MTDAVLDFRFAWRWLLPLKGCQRALLRGFDTIEQQFWQDALAPCKLARDEKQADAWIVDADRYKPVITPDTDALEHVRSVCVVGDGSAVARWRLILDRSFPEMREYGLLPHGQPRVVVPLDSPRNVVIALQLHRPGRWLARLGVGVARLLAGAGVLFPLKKRVLLVAVREPDTLAMGALQAALPARLPGSGLDYALYLGTIDGNRKTVVLLLGAPDPKIILKMGMTSRARQSLKNEAATLNALRDTPISIQAPKLIRFIENSTALTLYQEYRARRPVSRRILNTAVIDFLIRLSTINRQSRLLASVLEENWLRSIQSNNVERSDALAGVWGRFRSLANTGMIIWEHRSHGDFAPWNCTWTEQGIFVYDWEESQALELAFSDAFYYVIAPVQHVSCHLNAEQTIKNALAFAEKTLNFADVTPFMINSYFAIWLLKKLWRQETEFYWRILIALNNTWSKLA